MFMLLTSTLPLHNPRYALWVKGHTSGHMWMSYTHPSVHFTLAPQLSVGLNLPSTSQQETRSSPDVKVGWKKNKVHACMLRSTRFNCFSQFCVEKWCFSGFISNIYSWKYILSTTNYSINVNFEQTLLICLHSGKTMQTSGWARGSRHEVSFWLSWGTM